MSMDKGRGFVVHLHFVGFVKKVIKLETLCQAMVRKLSGRHICVSPPNSCVEALTSSVTVWELVFRR